MMGYLLRNNQYSQDWETEQGLLEADVFAGRWSDGIQKTIRVIFYETLANGEYALNQTSIFYRAIRGETAHLADLKAMATVEKLKTMTLNQLKEWAKVIR